ncbi:enhancer of rudimentary [Dichotomocladium elegans]|nr:enhancer of rudimentary [Dichotomocladium elegans]
MSPSDRNTVSAAMDAIADYFEQHLQRENARAGQIQYSAEDLFQFIDGHKEFVALVFEPAHNSYMPRDKEWIKERLLAHFSRPAAQDPPQYRRNQGPRGGSYSRGGNRRW